MSRKGLLILIALLTYLLLFSTAIAQENDPQPGKGYMITFLDDLNIHSGVKMMTSSYQVEPALPMPYRKVDVVRLYEFQYLPEEIEMVEYQGLSWEEMHHFFLIASYIDADWDIDPWDEEKERHSFYIRKEDSFLFDDEWRRIYYFPKQIDWIISMGSRMSLGGDLRSAGVWNRNQSEFFDQVIDTLGTKGFTLCVAFCTGYGDQIPLYLDRRTSEFFWRAVQRYEGDHKGAYKP